MAKLVCEIEIPEEGDISVTFLSPTGGANLASEKVLVSKVAGVFKSSPLLPPPSSFSYPAAQGKS